MTERARPDVQGNSDYDTKLFVPQLPPDVYAALADPWGTHPDDLLAAVNAARVMPRAQVSLAPHGMRAKGKAGQKNSLTNVRLRLQNQEKRYWQWMEEGVNYPGPLVTKRLLLRTSSARSSSIRQPVK